MTVSAIANLGRALTIPVGSANSEVVESKEYWDSAGLMIYGPAAITGPTNVVIQVSFNGTTFKTLEDATGDITAPGAGKARMYTEMMAANYWRIHGDVNVTGADAVYQVTKHWTA